MFHHFPTLLQGLPVSLILTVSALVLALLLALLFTYCLMLNKPWLTKIVKCYVVIFTGTPMLIQFFLITYGPGQFSYIVTELPNFWAVISNLWFCAIATLTLNSAAYTTQLFHGAVNAIPKEQWQACIALGMSTRQQICFLLPYAVRKALPAYSNEVILVFKGTSLASTITMMDVMGYTKRALGSADITVLVDAAIIYLAINALLTLIMYIIERNALAFDAKLKS